MFGILILDKPKGPPSQKILSFLRQLFQQKKMGYLGTLDPFATGVLPIFLGQATKLIPYIKEEKKSYEATLKMGELTDTLDETGETLQKLPVPELDLQRLQETFKTFLGNHQQKPPAYSAVKIKGVPLYRYARKGVEIEAKERSIQIYSIKLLEWNSPALRFQVEVSPGTYIRVLGADIAKKLGCVGHLTELRRLQSGPFHLDQAVSLEEVEQAVKTSSLEKILEQNWNHFLQIFSHFEIKDPQMKNNLLQGKTIFLSDEEKSVLKNIEKEEKVLILHEGKLISVAQWVFSEDQKLSLKPLTNFLSEQSE